MSDATTTNDQTDDSGKDDGKGADDVTGLKTALQSERDARKAAEKSAKDLARELESIKNSGKSEAEKLAARLEALEKDVKSKSDALRDRDTRDAAIELATEMGTTPKTAGTIWKAIKNDVEFNADGTPSNLKTLLAEMKTENPDWFKPKTTRVDGGAGNGSKPGKADMNSFIRVAAGREG